MTKTSQERFQVSSENGGSDAMWNNVGTRGGGHTGQALTSHNAGHQNINGPMCVFGRHAQAQRPTRIPTVIANAKYADRPSRPP